MVTELEEKLGVKFPSPESFTEDSFRRFLDDLCVKNGVDCSNPRTSARLLDKVIVATTWCTCIPVYLYFCFT